MTRAGINACVQSEQVCAYAIGALAPTDRAAIEAHLKDCADCRDELQTLRSTVAKFVAWPTDVVRSPASLWDRIAQRVTAETGAAPLPDTREWIEPEWEQVAPGISCKLLATDRTADRVSMLVRLEPNTTYPSHTHASVEELHLLHGELWIDDRKLFAGDYNLGHPGQTDLRVWSETGCTCVLVTSPSDQLR